MLSVSRYAFLLIILSSLLCLTACEPVAATAPFFSYEDVIYDPGLEGRWILYGDNQPILYDDHETSDAPIKLIFSGHPEKKTYSLRLSTMGAGNELTAVLFQIDGEQFLDMTPSGEGDPREFLPSTMPTHIVFRLKHQGDVLVLAHLHEEWTKQEIPEEQRYAEGHWERNPVLLLPTSDLRKLLSKALKEPSAFYAEYRFSRKDSESSARDMADYGYRKMAEESMRRGDYASALKSLQVAFNARPDNNDTRILIAFMQAANGDSGAARSSITEWIRQCRAVLDNGFGSGNCAEITDQSKESERTDLDVTEHILMALSYFADANWSETEREFQTAQQNTTGSNFGNFDSNDVIFFRALALIHLGRKSEATTLLTSDKFTNQNKVLADYFVGKIKDEDLLEEMKKSQTGYSKDSCNTECTTYFFIGSRSLAEGNTEKVRVYFQKSQDTKEFLDLIPAIARLRLQQLDQR